MDYFSQHKYEKALGAVCNEVNKLDKLELFTQSASTFMTRVEPSTIFRYLLSCKYDNFRELRLDKLYVAIQNIK